MTFFDELGKTLTDMGRDAAQKAKEVAETLQLKSQLSSEKSRVNDLYAIIGKAYFESNQDVVEEKFKGLHTDINNALTNIATLEEKIRQLDGNRTCPVCGGVLDRSAVYCSHCGASVKPVGEAKAPTENTEPPVDIEDAVVREVEFEEEIFEDESK